jgi:hypothetical protein
MDSIDPFWSKAESLTDEFKIALADLIVNSARVEVMLDHLISWAGHIPNRYAARILTGDLNTHRKRDVARRLLQELDDEQPYNEFKRILGDLEKIASLRNEIVHGW